jgi:hypothetical protein
MLGQAAYAAQVQDMLPGSLVVLGFRWRLYLAQHGTAAPQESDSTRGSS